MRAILSPLKNLELDPASQDWRRAGLAACTILTLYRIVLFLFDQTDLFVDESQYWLWGQNLDFGYYSKPPLIAWTIRLFTELGQSDSIFWVRLPVPLFHFATALILGSLARYLYDERIACWVMISYITMPAVTLGSAVISTDTIMAPFFSLALLFYFRLLNEDKARYALLAGAMAGLAFLAKYAGIYFVVCAVLAAVFMSKARPSLRNGLLVLVTFVIVAMPNLVWNYLNDLSTFEHTLDNADWVRRSSSDLDLKYLKLAEFFFSQFGVFGPILFGSLIASVYKARETDARILLFFSVPIILIVCVQALLSKAYANWAVAAYFGGTVLVVAGLLQERFYRLLSLSVWIGVVVAVGLPILTAIAYHVSVDGEKPALKRLLGRERLSQELIEAAKENNADIILAAGRDILADLFYTGRDAGFVIRSIRPRGRPTNYYQLNYALDESTPGQVVLWVAGRPTVECDGETIEPVRTLTTQGGAYHGGAMYAFVMDRGCFDG
ncbi:glycosyltransferase family 39 protein [Nitratireductor sp. XY-223]|uniref:ArnT family glycosyltransferase n=1 Tax=Nitratireductor sp. XY-223 TaxID=2561926 RepID=UPI00145A7A48|nr:glycosyltransferase family 39 protein [Nitratireductor sp. XY-223]